jgi:hypothetical protein
MVGEQHDQEIKNKMELPSAPPKLKAYHMRRRFKMRDPFNVSLARGWAQQMAYLEFFLFAGGLFCIWSICWFDCEGAPAEDDDDTILVGVQLTRAVRIRKQ